MAHLRCTHERRVIVVRDSEKKPVIRHRSDGGKCDARYVAVDKAVYEPAAHIATGTSQDKMFGPLGPMVIVGTFAEAEERQAKPVRRIKKHKR